jgi:2-polyprenyl-6-methoxyphenol hydroxylase-like FAD-dependent oxidoreductase
MARSWPFDRGRQGGIDVKVVVIGAGIGGLTTALRLHHHGIGCEVFEQSGQIRSLGVGSNLLPHAVGELAALGLLDRLAEAGISTAELFHTHRLGHEILRKPCGLDAGFTVPQLSFHRGRLQGVLLDAVRERLGSVHTGRRLIAVDQDSAGVRARFTDGELGDAAHPMYPMGSNGAGQAILDATSLVDHLVREPDPARALRSYQDERLPLTAEVVLRNRTGGPEGVIDEVERRAPDGFDRLDEVISAAEIETALSSYAQATHR